MTRPPSTARLHQEVPRPDERPAVLSPVPAKQARERDAGVETLRGVAVLLMVAGHVIGSNARSGLHLPDDSWWHHAYYTLAPLRMPLFTGISGFVYALRPATGAQWSSFMTGKLRRLLVPLLVVGSAFVALQAAVPETDVRLGLRELPWLLVVPYAHFWYLYALAWVFLVVGSLDALGLLARRDRLLGLVIAALALRASGVLATPVLGLWHAQNLLPFFLVGLWMRRFPFRGGWRFALVLLVLGASGVVLREWHWPAQTWSSDLELWAIRTTVGATGIAACLQFRRPWKPLALLGSFSYGIYLLHVFGTAGARILLQRAGVASLPVLGVAGLLLGVLLPIAVERVIERWPWLVLLVLGRRPRIVRGRSRQPARLVT